MKIWKDEVIKELNGIINIEKLDRIKDYNIYYLIELKFFIPSECKNIFLIRINIC